MRQINDFNNWALVLIPEHFGHEMHFIVVIRSIRFVCANPDVFVDLRVRFLFIRETSRKVPVPLATFDNLYIDAAVLFQTRKLTINILRRRSALALTRFNRRRIQTRAAP